MSNPAASVAQQRLFGAALALKRGEVSASSVTPQARALARTLSEKKLREFAATKHAGLPARVENPLWVEVDRAGHFKLTRKRPTSAIFYGPFSDEKEAMSYAYGREGEARVASRLRPAFAKSAKNPVYFDPKELALGMKEEREHADITGGDPTLTRKIAEAHLRETPNYYSRLKSKRCGLNPITEFLVGDVVRVAGRQGLFEVFTNEEVDGAILVRSLSGGEPKPAKVRSVTFVSRGNPKGRGPWVIWHKGCARVRNGRDQEKTLLKAGYKRVGSFKSHDEADKVADAQYGGRTNPKLLVVNPDEFVAKVEAAVKRRLTQEEQAQLMQARKEYRTFHGRDPDSLVPVNVPNGTPRFVNLVGDVDRIDYTVKANSARKGRWTHKAGDHGRTAKRTKPALLVSVPGKKAPPVFAQRQGSEMFFKPTHGIMG